MDTYQNLPSLINPVALRIGYFAVHWYALMYAVAFLVVYGLVLWRLRHQEGEWKKTVITDCLMVVFLGAIIGGRIGYVFLYDFAYYLDYPLQIISPLDPVSGEWVGIYGMSYFGGLFGALLSGWWFARKNKLDFWKLADFIAPAVPAGYFFGRIGNFMNGELFGRVTSGWWGMYFPKNGLGLLRHPSQLYEAFLEGAALFIVLWLFRNKSRFPGQLIICYVASYVAVRFLIEFVRQPDELAGLIFGIFTWGQLYAVLAGAVGGWFYWKRRGKGDILSVAKD